MAIATKAELMAARGPLPLTEILSLPGTDQQIKISGIVRSYGRGSVYREIEEMCGLKDVVVDGERIPVTEDDIVAACWAEACVTAPKLTSLEWLTVGAVNTDLLSLIGIRCLVNSRLLADENHPDGVRSASAEFDGARDPLGSSPSDSVSSGSEGCQEKWSADSGVLGSGTTKLITA